MATQVILLERVESLGQMGDVVSVRPGYARNYLLPQRKALRASKENIAYFEAQKKVLAAENDKKRAEAEKLAKKLDNLKAPLIRQASEAGQLYGSVTSRDIADQVNAAAQTKVERSQVILNQNFKTVGLFPVEIQLHPEVRVTVIVNIARSPEEAEIQAKTGKALIADDGRQSNRKAEVAEEDALAGVLEEDALEATKERQAAESAEASEEAAESAAKSKARAEKKKAKKAEEPEAEASESEVG